VSFVVKLMQRFHATGSFKPSDFGGHGKPKLAEHEAVVRELVEQTPSATLLELRGGVVGARHPGWEVVHRPVSEALADQL
jgi:transposase